MPGPRLTHPFATDEPLDPRTIRTREAVDQAVWSLVREHCSTDLSMADIARRARVSRQALYDNYSDRDTLIAQVATARLRAVIAAALAKQDCTQRELTEAFLAHLRQHEDFYIPVFAGHTEAFHQQIEEFLAHGYGRSLASAAVTGPEQQVLALFLAGGTLTLIRRWLQVQKRSAPTPAQLADQLDTLLSHLRPAAGSG